MSNLPCTTGMMMPLMHSPVYCHLFSFAEEAPSIEDHLPSVIVTTAGQNITLPCKALGAPLPQVTWFRNG